MRERGKILQISPFLPIRIGKRGLLNEKIFKMPIEIAKTLCYNGDENRAARVKGALCGSFGPRLCGRIEEGEMVRVVIVEDEQAESERLQSLLERYSRENGMQFEVQTYTSSLTFLAEYNRTVDIVFMDIELPDVNGMEISRRLRKQDAAVMIVFVTNMAQFAVQGYEVAAQDFIVKPAQYGEFALKLAKALVQLDRQADRYIRLTCNGVVRCIGLNALYYVEVIEHLIIYHTEGGNIEVTGSLKAAEQQLAGRGFVRCNSCYLVNLRAVREVNDTDAVLVSGDRLRVSRSKRKAFLQALADFYGGA